MNRRRAVVALVAFGVLRGSPGLSAQQPLKVWRVGFLSLNSAAQSTGGAAAFVQAMRGLGYAEGRNLVIEWRFADGNFERLPDMAADLVQRKVDVIVAVASAAIGAAQHATTTIPIVMATTGDPVGSGFVKSLARPGGNITGISNMGGDIGAKLFDLLLEVVPKPSLVAVLVSPTSTTYRAITESIRGAATKASVRILVLEVSNPQEIEPAFATMAREHAGALIVGAAPFFAVRREQVAELALKYRLPSMHGNRASVAAGGMMGYGSATDNFARSAVYVDRIFRGAKPGDLPVEQPARLELVINLKTATALGVTIPKSILLRADEVIR